MKLRMIAAVLLLAVIAGALWAAGTLREQAVAVRENYTEREQELAALNDRVTQLQQTLEGLSTSDADARQAQAEQLNREAEELYAQLEQLRIEIETMKTYLEENQDAVADAQAELTYLQGVYDELEEGLAKVEGYIAGN